MTNVQTISFIQRTLNIDPPIHRAVLYRPLYISVYRYIIPNVNPSIMLSGPFHIYIYIYIYIYTVKNFFAIKIICEIMAILRIRLCRFNCDFKIKIV